MITAQFSDQIEDVSISCKEDLTVETKQVNTKLQWNFRVQTEVRPDPLPWSSLRDDFLHLSTFPVFTTLNLWNQNLHMLIYHPGASIPSFCILFQTFHFPSRAPLSFSLFPLPL